MKNANKRRTTKKAKQMPKPNENAAASKIDKTKFKTEMCKNWIEQGFCRYGHKCQFAHGTQEVVVKNDPVNDKYKSKQCKQFHERAFCTYGRRCQFRHDEGLQFSEVKNYYYVHKVS